MEKFKKTLIQTGLLRKFIPYTPNYTNSKPMWRIYLQFLRFYPSRKAGDRVKFVPYVSSRALQKPPSRNNLNRVDIVKFDPRFYYR